MTDGTEETIPDPKRSRRGVPRKPRAPICNQSWAAARESSASAAEWAKVSRVAHKALALLLPDKGPRSMEISTIYTSQEGGCDDQDTQHECETETEQCGVDETQQCEETEQWLSEDD